MNAVEDPDAWASPQVADWGLREAFGPETALFDMPRSYAAPEQIAPERFGAVDAATDIYGLGVIGYELLNGDPPDRDGGTVRPAQAVGNGVPGGLSTVLTKSLKPAKIERYASAAAFKRDLAAEGNNA